MSFQSRIGCWWVRLYVKRKPSGAPALVDFTRRRFRTPAWLVWLHSLGVKIQRVESPVKVTPENESLMTELVQLDAVVYKWVLSLVVPVLAPFHCARAAGDRASRAITKPAKTAARRVVACDLHPRIVWE